MGTQQLVELTLDLDGEQFHCQFEVMEHIPPAYSGGTKRTWTACPNVVIDEDEATWTNGQLRGTAFVDTADTGITWILRKAQHDRRRLTYTITHFPELGPTKAIVETGEAQVNSFTYGQFARTGEETLAKHDVDLALITTNGPERPAAVQNG